MDQRRLLRARPQGDRPRPRRRDAARARAARGARPLGPAHGLPPHRLLATDGHAARPQSSRIPVGLERRAVEGVGVTGIGSPAFWRDRPTLVTGATGLLGGWLV